MDLKDQRMRVILYLFDHNVPSNTVIKHPRSLNIVVAKCYWISITPYTRIWHNFCFPMLVSLSYSKFLETMFRLGSKFYSGMKFDQKKATLVGLCERLIHLESSVWIGYLELLSFLMLSSRENEISRRIVVCSTTFFFWSTWRRL